MELAGMGAYHRRAGSYTCAIYLILLALFLLSGVTATTREASKLNYSGHKVVRVRVPDWIKWSTLKDIIQDAVGQDEVDYWAEDRLEAWVDVRVSPQQYKIIHQTLEINKIPHYVHIQDVQQLIDHEEDKPAQSKFYQSPFLSSKSSRVRRALFSNDIIGTYARFDDIKQYLLSVGESFSEIATVTTIGNSYAGLPLVLLKLGIPADHEKPAMWMDGTTHAREWITPASLLYIIYKLLDGYLANEEQTMALLYQIDWYILPVVNPDGYEWSHLYERMWRKNHSPNFNSSCWGTDLNRNWNFHWGGDNASPDPCSSMYHGASAGSELETQALAANVLELRNRLLAFSTVHSYTQYLFIRWAYTTDKSPAHEDQIDLGQKAVDAVVASGNQDYKVGQAYEYLYSYSGGSPDWAAGVAGIKYTFGIELRDKGTYGFLLPVEFVEPVGKELLAGMLVIAEHLANITCGGRNISVAHRYSGGWNGSEPDCDFTEKWWLRTEEEEEQGEAEEDDNETGGGDGDEKEVDNLTEMGDDPKPEDGANNVDNNIDNSFPQNRAGINNACIMMLIYGLLSSHVTKFL